MANRRSFVGTDGTAGGVMELLSVQENTVDTERNVPYYDLAAKEWKVGKPRAARVYRTTNLSVASSTETTVTWDAEEYDDGSTHDLVSNTDRLTAQESGIYVVVGVARWQGGVIGTNYNHGVFAQQERHSPAYAGLLYDPWMHLTAVLKLAAGDYLHMNVFQTQGATINLRGGAASDSSFAMTLVQRTS
jgi:hypothetical protein